MTGKWIVVAAALSGMAFLPASRVKAAGAGEPAAWGQQYGWDAPPREFNEVQRRGFRDGVEGARKDFGNGRRPNVNNREEYRDRDDMPHDIPRHMRRVYRDAFRRGYEVAASHLWAGGPRMAPAPAPAPPPGQWAWGMRGLRSDAQRRGYNEGIEEARKDFQFRRRQDPDDHEEYRRPPVPPGLIPEYREGFMRGYTVAMSQLNGDPDWQQQYGGDPGQWQAPQRYSAWARRGFHDGVIGANKDRGNSRYPDPNNRDEYRRPNVPPQFVYEYRDGFRRGYEMAAARLWSGQ